MKKVGKEQDLSEIPRKQRQQPRKSLSSYAERYPRNKAMRLAYDSGEYTLKVIADYFGVHYSTVSRVVNQDQ